jgi:hypothetical protein
VTAHCCFWAPTAVHPRCLAAPLSPADAAEGAPSFASEEGMGLPDDLDLADPALGEAEGEALAGDRDRDRERDPSALAEELEDPMADLASREQDREAEAQASAWEGASGGRPRWAWILGDDRVPPPPSPTSLVLGNLLLCLYHPDTEVVVATLGHLRALLVAGFFCAGAVVFSVSRSCAR